MRHITPDRSRVAIMSLHMKQSSEISKSGCFGIVQERAGRATTVSFVTVRCRQYGDFLVASMEIVMSPETRQVWRHSNDERMERGTRSLTQ